MNSILCRAALVWYGMGPLQYTAIRCLSGAVMLALICSLRLADRKHAGTVKEAFREAFSQSSWLGGAFLFGYMFCFSLCYVDMPAAAGTLILNVSVQFGMLGWGIWAGMRPNGGQTAGLFLATGGLVALLMPGLEVPPLVNGLLMMGSGLCWSGYSLCGRRSTSAGLATVGNFLRASVFALAACALLRAYSRSSLFGPGLHTLVRHRHPLYAGGIVRDPAFRSDPHGFHGAVDSG